MTTPSTQRKAGPLLGTGAQTSWPFTFKVFAESDIAVTIADSLGVETALVLNTDYSVSLNANQDTSPGGTVTYPISGSALPVGSVLSITGDLDYDQPLDIPSGGNFSPAALENELDRIVMQVQQLKEEINRSLRASVTTGADVELPAPESTALIGWNTAADGLQNYQLSDLATAVAYATMRYDTFTGDGVTTQFTLQSDPATLGNMDVSVDGQTYVPDVDHTLVGQNVVFTVAPSLGAEILVRYGQGVVVAAADAQDVSYLPAGTGAVATTVQTALRETVSVTRFGAVGDGVTDDAAAVQLAINYVATLGRGAIVFPPGYTYYLNSQINLCDNLTVIGYGAKIKIGTGYAGINTPLFKNFSGTDFAAPGTRLASSNIGFYGLTFDGNDTGVAGSTVPNANMHGAIICVGGWDDNSGIDGFVVRDCSFSSFAGAGVMVWKSSNIDVSSNSFLNFFTNATLSVGSPIDMHQVSRVVIANNRINHTSTAKSWHGITILDWTLGCSDVAVTGNVITNLNNGDGISCESNGVANIDGGAFTGNVIDNCLGDGLHIQGCSDVVVTGNIFRASSSTSGLGIVFTNTTAVTIDGNEVSGPYISGIFSNGGTLRAVVTNNRIQGMVYGGVNYQGEGIFLYTAGGTSVSHRVCGNIIKDVDGCGIYSNSTMGCVSGNSIYNFGRSASATRNMGITASGMVVDNTIIGVAATGLYGINVEDGCTVKNNTVTGTFSGGPYRQGWRNGVYDGGYLAYSNIQFDDITKKVTLYASAAPVANRWVVGDVVYNTAPAAAGTIGWVCTTAGVPGTWKTFGAIAA